MFNKCATLFLRIMATKKPKTLPKDVRIIAAITLIAFAVLIIIAIAPWSASTNADPNYRGLNLFSYFTIQSNFIAATVYLISAFLLLTNSRLGAWFGWLRGAAVLYMLVTGLVYTLLLQNASDAHAALGFNWRNFVLHQIGPLFILAQWLLWPAIKAISVRQALLWMIFPIIWLIYTFIRAGFTGWYPYPFLDPSLAGGTGGVILYVIGIAIGFFLLAQLIAWISRLRARNFSL